MEALGVNPFAILLHAINFLILLFLLQRFLYKPVMTMLDQRAATIRESVEAAERARQESARADQERLEALREAWRQAEEIAAIADDMFLPASVDAELARLRAQRGPHDSPPV